MAPFISKGKRERCSPSASLRGFSSFVALGIEHMDSGECCFLVHKAENKQKHYFSRSRYFLFTVLESSLLQFSVLYACLDVYLNLTLSDKLSLKRTVHLKKKPFILRLFQAFISFSTKCMEGSETANPHEVCSSGHL